MQPRANKHRQTDYTNQLRPRRHSVDGLSTTVSRPVGGAHHPHPKNNQNHSNDEEYRVSININLPDYNQWRVAKFARHYPYLSIGLAFLGLLAFALFMEGLVLLWHSLTHHSVKAAAYFMPRIR